MAKLLKQILIVLMLAAFLPLAAFAAQQPAPYPAGFWVNGTLQKDASSLPPTLDGFKVYFYKSSSAGYVPGADYAVASSDANGNFSINALEDLGLLPLSATKYYFGVAKKEFTVGGVKRSWGINEKDLTLTAADINNGYMNLTALFTSLVEGQGLNPTGETSGLTILRAGDSAGSDITIKWDPTKFGGSNPRIYVMTGNGYGDYLNTYDASVWYQVFDGTVLTGGYPAYFGTFALGAGNTLIHKSQVGTGSNEVYYKGFVGVTPPDATFAQAPAVGKVNVFLQGQSATTGKNLVSVPFSSVAANSVGEIFGDGSDAVWKDGDMIQAKIAPSPAYLSAVYKSGAWKDAADATQDPKFTVNYLFGNWAIIKEDKTITLVGNVIYTDSDVAVYDGNGLPSGGKTLLGMIYPVKVGLTSVGLTTSGAADGDMIQYKDSPLAPSYISAVVVGGQWKNAADTASPMDSRIATLRLPSSYVFVRYGTSGFTWKRTKPY